MEIVFFSVEKVCKLILFVQRKQKLSFWTVPQRLKGQDLVALDLMVLKSNARHGSQLSAGAPTSCSLVFSCIYKQESLTSVAVSLLSSIKVNRK